jgi:hypothetical protein
MQATGSNGLQIKETVPNFPQAKAMVEVAHAFRLDGEPQERPAVADFARVERDLGLVFPLDYKKLVSFYGAGSIEFFFRVFSPVATGRGRTPRELQESLEAVVAASGGYRSRLFPWGSTANGDDLCWALDGPPDTWHVVVRASRQAWYEEHATGCVEFLTRMCSGSLSSEILPAMALPEGQKPTFRPSRVPAS